MARLQTELGSRGLRGRGHALRALPAHLAAGHRTFQQVRDRSRR